MTTPRAARRPPYVPDRGDVIQVNFDPQAGHEQKGRRPALVLSPRAYNEKVGLAILCPITSTGLTVERVASTWLAESAQRAGQSGRQPPWLGAFESEVPDAAARHHDYLGQTLYEDLRRESEE